MFKKAVKIGVVVVLLIAFAPVAVLLVLAACNGRTPSDTDFARSPMLAQPPAPLTKSITIKAVTFNVYDLYHESENRPERMAAIGRLLAEMDPDLVGIQEAFIEKDRQALLDALGNSRLAYHEYYPSGTVGSGKFILSAFPIVEAYFHRFEDTGGWYKVWEGDWWAGKGVALARVELPRNAGYLDFYNTHLQADYGNPAYELVKESQMRGLAGFIVASAIGTAPALLAGDINCRIGSPAYNIAQDKAGLQRMMAVDSRIDHIFAVANPRYGFEVLATEPLTGEIETPDGPKPLSDHTGYCSTIRITPQPYDAAVDSRPGIR